MSRNLIALVLYGASWLFLTITLVLEHLMLISGSIAGNSGKMIIYEMNSYAIWIAVAVQQWGIKYVHPEREHYSDILWGSRFIIGLCVLHTIALATKIIYDLWYLGGTLVVMILLTRFFFKKPLDANRNLS